MKIIDLLTKLDGMLAEVPMKPELTEVLPSNKSKLISYLKENTNFKYLDELEQFMNDNGYETDDIIDDLTVYDKKDSFLVDIKEKGQQIWNDLQEITKNIGYSEIEQHPSLFEQYFYSGRHQLNLIKRITSELGYNELKELWNYKPITRTDNRDIGVLSIALPKMDKVNKLMVGLCYYREKNIFNKETIELKERSMYIKLDSRKLLKILNDILNDKILYEKLCEGYSRDMERKYFSKPNNPYAIFQRVPTGVVKLIKEFGSCSVRNLNQAAIGS